MEYRKLIEFGKGSYIVSIPKRWIKKQNLKKGALLLIETKEDSVIIRTKPENKEKIIRKATIITANMDPIEIKNRITSEYINGVNNLTIILDGKKNKYLIIEKVIQELIAFEIMDQTQTQIVVKDFLNVENIDVETPINKIDMILRTMFQDSIEKTATYEELNTRDKQVNRLRYLVFRGIKELQKSVELRKISNISNERSLQIWKTVSNLEQLGDRIKVIAKIFENNEISKKDEKELKIIYEKIKKIYLDTMNCFYKNDKEKAHKLTKIELDILKICENDESSAGNKEKILNEFILLMRSLHQIIKMIIY